MEEFINSSPDLFRGFIAFFMAYMFIMLGITALMIVSIWKIFTKAGKPGWAVLVPGYSLVIMLEVAKKPGPWVFIFLYGILVPLAGPIAALVFYILMLNGISKSFGYSAGFTVGLFFLPLIFFPIVAFGGAKYIDDESHDPMGASLDSGQL